ncbi:MAG: MotA/TolQ/ExbB proton channel family protein [Spirochaetaceae bacterium]|jgi:biopolymer transport protein ExbB|nr:MotA/TolQ/ExbB proton channel family protein [Spirochaetaceae bacterium]
MALFAGPPSQRRGKRVTLGQDGKMSNAEGLQLLEFFRMGGIFMWPLLVFSIATVSIALERVIFLLSHDLRMEELNRNVMKYAREKDIAGAKEYLAGKTKRSAGARILLALLNRAGQSESMMEKAAETEALNRVNELESGFDFLTALGAISPLTGFLGTVSGMIGAFKSIAEATEVNAQIVANGIYEALITTVFGLIIAIIAMVANSLLTHAVDGFAAAAEKSCSELILEIASGGN